MNYLKNLPHLGLCVSGLAMALLLMCPWQIENASAQDPKAKPAVPASQKKRDEKPPEPEPLILDTPDGVRLKCTYFAPPTTEGVDGKAVIPVILLHDWEGNRGQLLRFGNYLQSRGYAVIVPDLRGHGESTQLVGSDKPINLDRFRKTDVVAAQKDIERCKKFLVQRHNEGQLNIDMLSVLAVGESGVLATQWTFNDWFAFPPYNAQGIKQGQDVKSLILVSPRKKIAGISIIPILRQPLFTGDRIDPLPMLILWGAEDEEAAKDSASIHASLEKARPDVSQIEDATEKFEKTTLFGEPVAKTKLTGVELMDLPDNNILWPYIESFLAKKVAAKSDSIPWTTREQKKND